MKRENRNKQMQSLWHIKPPAPREKRYGKHPTQKPEALLDRIIRASSNPHDIVLDPFCGSGTTGVACARLGRAFIGIDLMLPYLEIAMTRLRDEIDSRQLSLTFSRVTVETIWIEPCSRETCSVTTWREIVTTALQTRRRRSLERNQQACPAKSTHEEKWHMGFNCAARRETISLL